MLANNLYAILTNKGRGLMYSAKKWATVKADYETGNFSAEELWKKYGIHQRTIENRIKGEKWVKGKSKPLIAQGIAERNIAMFAKLGMTQEKVVQKLIDGIDSANRSAQYIADQVKAAKDKDEEVDTDWLFKIIPQIMDDRKIALQYLQELNKMCGTHAPQKKDITSDGEKLIAPNIHMYVPDNGRNNT